MAEFSQELRSILASDKASGLSDTDRRKVVDSYWQGNAKALQSDDAQLQSMLQERERFIAEFNTGAEQREIEASINKAQSVNPEIEFNTDNYRRQTLDAYRADNDARVQEFNEQEAGVQSQNDADDRQAEIEKLQAEIRDIRSRQEPQLTGGLGGAAPRPKGLDEESKKQIARKEQEILRHKQGGIKSDKLRPNHYQEALNNLNNAGAIKREMSELEGSRATSHLAPENYQWRQYNDQLKVRLDPTLSGGFQAEVTTEDGQVRLTSPNEFNEKQLKDLIAENIDELGSYEHVWDTGKSVVSGIGREFSNIGGYFDKLGNGIEEKWFELDHKFGLIDDSQLADARSRINEEAQTNWLGKLVDKIDASLSPKERLARFSGADKRFDFISRGAVSEGFGQLAATAATGGAGSIGGKVAAKALFSSTGKAANLVGKYGATAGTAGGNFASMANNEINKALDEGEPLARAIGYGSYAALLNTPTETAADRLQIRLMQGSAYKMLSDLGMGNQVNRAGRAAQAAFFEGGTEAVQEVVSNAVETMYNANKEVFDAAQLTESAAVGAIIGGTTGAIRGQQVEVDAQASPDPLSEEKTVTEEAKEAQFEGSPAESFAPTGDNGFSQPEIKDTTTEAVANDPVAIDLNTVEQSQAFTKYRDYMQEAEKNPVDAMSNLAQEMNTEIQFQLNNPDILKTITNPVTQEQMRDLLEETNAFMAETDELAGGPENFTETHVWLQPFAKTLQGLTFLRLDQIESHEGNISDFYGDAPLRRIAPDKTDFTPAKNPKGKTGASAATSKYEEAVIGGRAKGQLGINIPDLNENAEVPVWGYGPDDTTPVEEVAADQLTDEELAALPFDYSDRDSIERHEITGVKYFTPEAVEYMRNEIHSEGELTTGDLGGAMLFKDINGSNGKGIYSIYPEGYLNDKIPYGFSTKSGEDIILQYIAEPYSNTIAGEGVKEYRVHGHITNGKIEVIPFASAHRSGSKDGRKTVGSFHRNYNPLMFETEHTAHIRNNLKDAKGYPKDFNNLEEGSIVGLDVAVAPDGSIEVVEMNLSDPQTEGKGQEKNDDGSTGRSGFLGSPFTALAIASYFKGQVPQHVRLAHAAMWSKQRAGSESVRESVTETLSKYYRDTDNKQDFTDVAVQALGEWFNPHASDVYDALVKSRGEPTDGIQQLEARIKDQLTDKFNPKRIFSKPPLHSRIKGKNPNKTSKKGIENYEGAKRTFRGESVQDILKHIAKGNTPGAYNDLARLLLKKLPEYAVPVRFRKENSWYGEYQSAYVENGYIYPESVSLASKSFEDGSQVETLLHEAIHVVTDNLLKSYESGEISEGHPQYESVKKFDDIRQLLIKAGAKDGYAQKYSQSDADYSFALNEFHTHVLTSQQFLMDLKPFTDISNPKAIRGYAASKYRDGSMSKSEFDRTNQLADLVEITKGEDGNSVLEWFMNIIKDLLGLRRKNVHPDMDAVLQAAVGLIETSPDGKPYRSKDWDYEAMALSEHRPPTVSHSKGPGPKKPPKPTAKKFFEDRKAEIDHSLSVLNKSVKDPEILAEIGSVVSSIESGNIPKEIDQSVVRLLKKFIEDQSPKHLGDIKRKMNTLDATNEMSQLTDKHKELFGKPVESVRTGQVFYSTEFTAPKQAVAKIGYHPQALKWMKDKMRFMFTSFNKYDRANRHDIDNFDKAVADNTGVKLSDYEQSSRISTVAMLTDYAAGQKDLNKIMNDLEKSADRALDPSNKVNKHDRRAAAEAKKTIQAVKQNINPLSPIEVQVRNIEGLLTEKELELLQHSRDMFAKKQEALISNAMYNYGKDPKRYNNYIRRSVRLLPAKEKEIFGKDAELDDSGSFEPKSPDSKVDKDSSVTKDRIGLGEGQYYSFDFYNLITEGLTQSNYEIYTGRDRAQLKDIVSNKDLQKELEKSANGKQILPEMSRIAKDVHSAETRPSESSDALNVYFQTSNVLKRIAVSSPSKLVSQLMPAVDGMIRMNNDGRWLMGQSALQPKRVSDFLKKHAPAITDRSKDLPDVLIQGKRRRDYTLNVGGRNVDPVKAVDMAVTAPNRYPDMVSSRTKTFSKYGQTKIEDGTFIDTDDFMNRFDQVPIDEDAMSDAIDFSTDVSASTIQRAMKAPAHRTRSLIGRALLDMTLAFSQTVSWIGQSMLTNGRNLRGLNSRDPEIRKQAQESAKIMASLALVQQIGFVLVDAMVKTHFYSAMLAGVSKLPFVGADDEEEAELKRQSQIEIAKMGARFNDNKFFSPRMRSSILQQLTGFTGPINILNQMAGGGIEKIAGWTGFDYGISDLKEERARLASEIKRNEKQLKSIGYDLTEEQTRSLRFRLKVLDGLINSDPAQFENELGGVAKMFSEFVGGMLSNPIDGVRSKVPFDIPRSLKTIKKASEEVASEKEKKELRDTKAFLRKIGLDNHPIFNE